MNINCSNIRGSACRASYGRKSFYHVELTCYTWVPYVSHRWMPLQAASNKPWLFFQYFIPTFFFQITSNTWEKTKLTFSQKVLKMVILSELHRVATGKATKKMFLFFKEISSLDSRTNLFSTMEVIPMEMKPVGRLLNIGALQVWLYSAEIKE